MPPKKENTAAEKFKRIADITRSGAKRYPRQIVNSFRTNGAAETYAQCQSELTGPCAGDLGASWLGHATVLLNIAGKWVLTDPVFSRRIGVKIGPWTIGMERLKGPHLVREDLPRIDLVLISHAHFDHLDRPSLRKLVSDETVLVTAARTGRLIPKGFASVTELDWEEDIEVGGLSIRALRPNHWGARTAWDRHRGYNSYVIESPKSKVLYAGDTAITDVYKRVAKEHGGVDLSIFGIGAYDPWIHAHASPEQVWEMHNDAGGKFLLPVHHSTFQLSNEPVDEPMLRLLDVAGDQRERIVLHDPGKLWVVGSRSESKSDGRPESTR